MTAPAIGTAAHPAGMVDPVAGVVASASVPPQPSQPAPNPVAAGTLTRDELAHHLGVAASTTYRWQSESPANGFPPPGPDGRWDPEPVTRWYTQFVNTKRAKLRPVDRDGDPDELLTAADVGRVLGYRGTDPGATIRSYRQPRHGGYFPDPDGYLTGPSGRQVQAWRRDTIWAFADRRDHHGGGARGRSGRPRSTTPPYANDPVLPTVRALLAETPTLTGPALAAALEISESKAYRLLKAAKTTPGQAGLDTAAGTD